MDILFEVVSELKNGSVPAMDKLADLLTKVFI